MCSLGEHKSFEPSGLDQREKTAPSSGKAQERSRMRSEEGSEKVGLSGAAPARGAAVQKGSEN